MSKQTTEKIKKKTFTGFEVRKCVCVCVGGVTWLTKISETVCLYKRRERGSVNLSIYVIDKTVSEIKVIMEDNAFSVEVTL